MALFKSLCHVLSEGGAVLIQPAHDGLITGASSGPTTDLSTRVRPHETPPRLSMA